MRTRTKKRTRIHLLGIFQDFVGQEGYINLIRNHWISGWYTVPGALLLLAMGILAWVGVVVAPEGK